MNQVAVYDDANSITGLASANNGLLVTSNVGVSVDFRWSGYF